MAYDLKIFSGSANAALTKKICEYICVPLSSIEISEFSDGEIFVRINENVRGADVFVIQSTCSPANKNLMELLIIIDALKRASAARITAVLPYYGYARQDRKVQPRVPITAKLVADLISAAGTSRILTMDLHAGQIQGFFDLPVDHLFAGPVLCNYFEKSGLEKTVIVAPDAGGVERARTFARRLKSPLAIIDKRRTGPNVAEVLNIIGEVEGKNAIIVDDMIDTAGTLIETVSAVKQEGALSIRAACSHPVFSGKAIERITNSELAEVVVTDSIPLNKEGNKCEKIKVLSVAALLGEAITRIHGETSLSILFE